MAATYHSVIGTLKLHGGAEVAGMITTENIADTEEIKNIVNWHEMN